MDKTIYWINLLNMEIQTTIQILRQQKKSSIFFIENKKEILFIIQDIMPKL